MSFRINNRNWFVVICLIGGLAVSTRMARSDPGSPEKSKATPAAKTPDADQPNSEKNNSEKNNSEKNNKEKNGQTDKKPEMNKSKGNKTEGKKPANESVLKSGTSKDGTEKVKNPNGDKSGEKGNVKTPNPRGGIAKGLEVTAEHEAKALEFVAKHHPEIVALLSPLKTSNPKEYQRAVRELFRTSERLENIRLREPARYDLELEAWKVQSNVRLLAARLVMESNPELEQRLKDELRKKADNRLQLMQFEQQSLKSRLEQLELDIEKSTKSVDQTVQQEYERLLKQTNRDKPVVKRLKTAKPGSDGIRPPVAPN